ncbi:MAG: hypothetical protein ACR2PL_05750 [Dehalococcoidia bacterium]
MTREILYTDITEIQGNPVALQRVLDEVRETRRSHIIRADGEDIVVIAPVPKRSPSRRSKRTSADDPFWKLIGIGRSEGPGDISSNKQKYLIEAKMSTVK